MSTSIHIHQILQLKTLSLWTAIDSLTSTKQPKGFPDAIKCLGAKTSRRVWSCNPRMTHLRSFECQKPHCKWIYWTSWCMQLQVHVGDPNLSQSMELHQNHSNQLNSLRIMWMDSPAKKKTTLPKQDPGLCLRISCSSAVHHGSLWATIKNEPGFASRVLIDFLFFSSSYFYWGILTPACFDLI